ncbi:MAG TPA: ribokinase [Anaerolineaceae bacterium]|nr:ribokinase [Anaerolineaceae bacterium]
MHPRILVVGSLNMDLVVRTPHHPALGETVLGSRFETIPGGKGANQAVAAARLDGRVAMVGRVGGDAFGQALTDNLARNQVDAAQVQRDPQAASGVALITVSADGQNTIVVAMGANAELAPEDLPVERFAGAQILLLQLETPLPTVLRAAQLAREHGMTVILNPAPAQPLPEELYRLIDYLVPNQTELALLAGGEPAIDRAVEKLSGRGVKHIVVTLGEDGCLLAGPETHLRIPAFQVRAVDTVAAGDAFLGALAVALGEGRCLEEAARWGNAAGAIAVTRPGAQPSLPDRAELEQFLEEHPA